MAIDIDIKSDLSIGSFNSSIRDSYTRLKSMGSDKALYGSLENYNQDNMSILQYRFPHDRPKFYMSLGIQTYSRKDLMEVNASLNTNVQLTLPVPMNITDAHGVSYEESNIGQFLGLGVNYAMGNQDQMRQVLNGQKSITDVGKDMVNNASPDALAGAGLAAVQSGAGGLTGNLARNIPGVLGLSPNEFFTVMLKGPQYKRHNFSWHLVPRNFTEAYSIKKIINILNNSMSPGLALGGAVFNFPKVFQLAFFPNYNYLFKFKPAILENMQVEYSSVGTPSFYHTYSGEKADSAPESVRITCQFMELEYWLHSDFNDEAVSPLDTRGTDRYSENVFLTGAKEDITKLVDKGKEWLNKLGANNTPIGD